MHWTNFSATRRWLAAVLLVMGLAVGWLAGPTWGVMAMAGGLLWLLTLFWPELALAALVAGFQLYPVLFELAGLRPTQWSSGVIYVLLTSGTVAGTLLRDPRRAWRRLIRPPGIIFLLMIGYFLMSWLVLTEKTPSSIQKMRYTVVIMIPTFLASLWLEAKRIPRFAWLVVWFSALGALAGATKRMLGLIPPEVKRLSLSTTSRSLQFAYSVGVGGLFSWVLARQGSRWRLAWAAFFSGVAFLMIFAAGSRGAFLALLCSLLVLFAFTGLWRRASMLLLAGAFLAAALLAPYFVIDRQSSIDRIWGSLARGAGLMAPWKTPASGGSGPENEADLLEALQQLTTRRTDYYQASWRMLQAHPWFGVGFGGYAYTNDKRQRYLYPHNYFLEIGAETGLVGLALFSALLGMALWRAVTIVRSSPDAAGWVVVTMMVYALIAGLVSYSITYHAMLWASLGLAFSLHPEEDAG